MILNSASQITHVLDQIMVSRQRVTLHYSGGTLPSRILAIDLRERRFVLKQPWQGLPAALSQPGTAIALTAIYQGRDIRLTALLVDDPTGESPPVLSAGFPSSLQVSRTVAPAVLP